MDKIQNLFEATKPFAFGVETPVTRAFDPESGAEYVVIAGPVLHAAFGLAV